MVGSPHVVLYSGYNVLIITLFYLSGCTVVFVSFFFSRSHIRSRLFTRHFQTNFIQQPLPKGSKTGAGGKHGVSGALGQKQETSTGLTTFLQFW